MKVSELMVTEVVTCRDTDALGEAARRMWEHDIGFLPVVSAEDGKLVGVVTDRDAFIAAYFQGKPLWDIPVRAAMSPNVATCPPDADVEAAERVMREFQVHRLPVVGKDGRVAGILSVNDCARDAVLYGDQRQEEEVVVTIGAICEPRATQPAAKA